MTKLVMFKYIFVLAITIGNGQNFVYGQEAVSDQSQVLTNSIGMKLVPIPAGRFTMGSPASERGSQEDEVLHKVDLTQAFHLGTTEVTEHQWAMVMEEPFRTEVVEIRDPDTKRLVKKEERQIKNPKLDSLLPVTGVSWIQAVEFCKRLGQLPEEKKEGRNYRLPTEAEWEYACRAGSMTAFSFGSDVVSLKDHAWYFENSSDGKPRPVAQLRANTWGLYDMHGNAAEWCNDCYGNYAEGIVSDPIQPVKPISLDRIIRGGAAGFNDKQCRSSTRRNLDPLSRFERVGLRCVMENVISVNRINTVENGIGQKLIRIPAGPFLMGYKQGSFSEPPVDEVTLMNDFFMAETEVTEGQWRSVIGTEPWNNGLSTDVFSTFPASKINWEEAVDFCEKLSARPEEVAAGRTYRLPTEAEWEYSCRAEFYTAFNFGDSSESLSQYACFDEQGQGINGSDRVKLKIPNFFGLYDMHGNVWEWCSNITNEPEDTISPEGINNYRVIRGGGFLSSSEDCQSSARSRNAISGRFIDVGFRVVMISPDK